MTKRVGFLFLLSVAIGVMPPQAAALCIDPTSCFCQLVPNGCEVLISAEVTAIAGDQVSLRVLEDPFFDPDGLVTNGMELTLTDQHLTEVVLAVGQKGLFVIHPQGACVLVGPDKPYLGGVAIDSNGTFPCDTYPPFVATDRAALLAVILGGNCRQDAWTMMGIEHYCEGTHGCCSSTALSLGGVLPVLLLGVVLVPRRRLR